MHAGWTQRHTPLHSFGGLLAKSDRQYELHSLFALQFTLLKPSTECGLCEKAQQWLHSLSCQEDESLT